MHAARARPACWGRRPWEERVATLRRAAALIRERKFDLAALMSIEVGKSRLEAMGDAEESADLIDYYCQQIADAHGFVRQMARITPIERNIDVLRPYGVFACIAPFNFPLALSAGMSAAALVAGNTIVYKPAEDAPWTGLKLYEIYRDAGIPAGVVQSWSGPPGRDRRRALAASGRRRRCVHGVEGSRHAHPRRPQRPNGSRPASSSSAERTRRS